MTESHLARRRVLRGIAGGLTAGAGLNWLLPEPRSSPIQREEYPSAPPVEPDPISEGETSYAVYQYASIRGRMEPTLPINVVAPLEYTTFEDLTAVFDTAGWFARPAEHLRYAYDRDIDAYLRCHYSAAETVFGVARRLHVRCWQLAGTASIQAHIDTVPQPGHEMYSFSAGAEAVATLFADAGWDVDPDAPETMYLGNAQYPDHRGDATVIRR